MLQFRANNLINYIKRRTYIVLRRNKSTSCSLYRIQLTWLHIELAFVVFLDIDRVYLLNMDARGYLYSPGAQAPRKSPLRQFSPLLVAMVGLPGRGKSLLARRLARYLNYTGDRTRGMYTTFFIIAIKNICMMQLIWWNT